MQQHTNLRTMSVRDISDNPTNDLQEEFAADPLLPTLMRQHNVLDYNDPPHMLGSAEDPQGPPSDDSTWRENVPAPAASDPWLNPS